MKFSLRALLITTAIFAASLGWLVHSLSTMNIDFASNGNDISFRDVSIAEAATNLSFVVQTESVSISVEGIDRPNARLEENVARFMIRIQGKIDRSVLSGRPIWPFTQSEFAGMIESELENRLGSNSDPTYIRKTLPMPE